MALGFQMGEFRAFGWLVIDWLVRARLVFSHMEFCFVFLFSGYFKWSLKEHDVQLLSVVSLIHLVWA